MLFSKEKETSKDNKKSKKDKNKPLTVQDLIQYDEITPKGIVRIGKTYTAVMETDQTNSSLLDYNENAILWNNFRVMLNSINIRYSMILQSHFFDVSDFVNDYETRANSLENLTPQLSNAKDDIIYHYSKFTEERNRDQRTYIIFRYNPDVEGIETLFETGNAVLDELFKKAKSTASDIDEEESRSIAISVLDEVAELAYQLLQKMNVRSVRLNRIGVLNMLYSTLNRDLTTSQRLLDVSEAHSFAEVKISESSRLFLEALETEEQDDMQLFAIYNNNHNLQPEIDDTSFENSREEHLNVSLNEDREVSVGV